MTQALTYTIPPREDAGDGWYYRATYDVVAVLDADAGPCKDCNEPMVKVKANQHVDHNGYTYTHSLDFLYLHADGAGPHDGNITNCVQERCTQCRAYGTTTTRDTGYGDEVNCSACGHSAYFDRGD